MGKIKGWSKLKHTKNEMWTNSALGASIEIRKGTPAYGARDKGWSVIIVPGVIVIFSSSEGGLSPSSI